jgi:Glycosyl transferase family 2
MISSQTAPSLATAESAHRPQLSIVIPWTSGPESLAACLRALEDQTMKLQVEVIVMSSGQAGSADLSGQLPPHAKLLTFAQRKSIPELRAIGMRQSEGAIVVIIEDHCNPEPHWYERILRAHEKRYGVIGGAVENDQSITRVVDWAVFFCEYSRYMNPVTDGEVSDIPGNNASYRREFLVHIADLLDAGCCWESALYARLRERGVKLYSDPSIIVYHKKEFGLGYFLGQRYHYSRSFAGARVAQKSVWRRLLYAASCVFLPLLLMARISWRVLSKKRHLDKFVLAVPLLALFSAIWAGGEWAGYLFGPGKSLLYVE